MERSKACGAIFARGGPRPQGGSGRSRRRLRESCLGLGFVGILVAAAGVAQPLPAQGAQALRRLTVRPREMATGTRTERAGEYQLDPPKIPWTSGEVPASRVYVPQQCAGTRRCPLVVFVWRDWEETMTWVRPMADKYGMVLLMPEASYQGLALYPDSGFAHQQLQHLDATLQQVLQKFAIDPDKIAIMGTCATGNEPVAIGGANLDVFSRIISLSGAGGIAVVDDVGPPNQTTEFFFDAGALESKYEFMATKKLRQRGHRVTHAVGFRRHGHQAESYDHVGRWLQESWVLPPAARPAPRVIADPLPVLTTDVLAKMTAFWTRFVKEPDLIRLTARRAYLRDVLVPVGEERPVVVMADMAALAAKYPSVAAALKAAGLTGQQHDAYRVAIASAQVTKSVEGAAGAVAPASVMAKNVAFLETHPDELMALENARDGSLRADY